jgi:hypothetical protein
MRVRLHWHRLDHDDHELWDLSPAIYSYTFRRSILYIGKADGTSSVRRRFEASDKDSLFDFFADELGVEPHQVAVRVGEFHFDGRLTQQMVADVESLLIAAVRPRGNIAAIGSRIARPGMSVRCIGDAWPSTYRHFVDDG